MRGSPRLTETLNIFHSHTVVINYLITVKLYHHLFTCGNAAPVGPPKSELKDLWMDHPN